MKGHYLQFLADVRGRDEASLDVVTKAIERCDDYNRRKDFKKFHFVAAGLDRAHWANAHPVRVLFKEAFGRVGLPYFNPHSFRNTLVQRAYEL